MRRTPLESTRSSGVAAYSRAAGGLLGSLLLASGCARALAAPDAVADALFARHDTWRGGDAAYSAALDGERVLWSFGDSWVGGGAPHSRSGRHLARNTIAIQHGLDPRSAGIEFYGDPFFDDGDASDATWLWPGPAVMIGSTLVVFLVEHHARGEGLFGFEAHGSRVVIVDDIRGTPDTWTLRTVAAPPRPPGVQLLGAALVEGGYLYLFGVVEPGAHDVHLGRISVVDAARGVFGGAAWFDGATSFGPAASSRPIVRGAQSELSVHRGDDGLLHMTSTQGFGGADIVERSSHVPSGPWSSPRLLFHPAAGDEARVLIYSAKAHPELQGGRYLTYCTNHEDFWTMASRQDLYFPRFLRVGEP